ncbi:MAG TPA: non-heme iron oxygenase ferredoxin subunit, partial [bacterium]|nr:non-heme iron oxygenase ferredoxin subunit [bacterium]
MHSFVTVCRVNEVPAGEGRGFVTEGHRVAIFHLKIKGLFGGERSRFYALADSCTHAYAALSTGRTHGCRVMCPLHGAWFDIRTGRALTPPATESARRYRVRVVGN